MIQSKRKNKKENKVLVSNLIPSSKISEQFRTLRTNLEFISDNEYRSFLVTSPSSKDGKSSVAVNLAISIAQQKRKVLLVDSNFRSPDLHTLFKCSNDIGLANILVGIASLEEAVTKTEIARLDVLTSGPLPINPAELLGSHPMKKLMQDILKVYDIVLFDSSSVLESADTSILAHQCNAVMLVIKKGKTKTMKAKESKRILEFAKANTVGIIFNGE